MFPNLPVKVHEYQLTELIGNGGQSSVYKAFHTRYLRFFAVKVLKFQKDQGDSLYQSFSAEIAALSKLDHQNIVRIYEHFREDDFLFLVLEYCALGTIESLVLPHKGTKSEQILNYTEAIISALSVCHKNGIAHRDLKPSNILLDEYGRPKLADFGFSYFKHGDQKDEHFLGTYAFVAPEVAKRQQYDPFLSDIWSLGVTLYHIWVGKPLWPSNDAQTMKKAILAAVLPKFTTGSSVVDRIIREMVRIAPESRMPLDQALELIKNRQLEALPRPKPPPITPTIRIPQVKTRTSLRGPIPHPRYQTLELRNAVSQPLILKGPRVKASFSFSTGMSLDEIGNKPDLETNRY